LRRLHGPIGLSSSRVGPRTLAVLAVVALALAAGDALAAPLGERLTRALTVRGVAWSATGAVAVDLRTGEVIYARNHNRALRPASNEKLPVALAALEELGPSFRIPTRVFGEGTLHGSEWRGRLVLKGYGDPALGRDDLRRLARAVVAQGIRRVTQPVVADESYFDARRTAPGWKPRYYKEECPPLSALIVAHARVGRRIVDDPALAAAAAFRAALRAEGIRIPQGARRGVARADATQLAEVSSPRIVRLVRTMNRESDNFVAEMLLKELGAVELGRGTTPAGASVVRRVLAGRTIPLAGVRIVDGSGLSTRNRLTAFAVASLLYSAARDTRIGAAFRASLAVAGINGTLEDRLEYPPARGNVFAKTGTTRNASALSGYVRARWVFAVLQNGYPIPWWYARRGQDHFAQVLAGN
jgi:serine-type D-Ala-D-Ala carboxypeptidase/endopeptidase (penicillin-binding protein 4)